MVKFPFGPIFIGGFFFTEIKMYFESKEEEKKERRKNGEKLIEPSST